MDVRAERRAVGLSQSQLARAAGIPQPNLSAYENGRRVPSPEVLDQIKRALKVRPSARVEQHRESIRALVAEHHAVSPRIFGSVARGEDVAGSDVDLLVDFTDEASLLDEIGLRLALEKVERAIELRQLDRFQAEVDLKTAEALSAVVASLDDIPSACIRIGSLLIVKHPDKAGSTLFARQLSQKEIATFDKYPELQQEPQRVLQGLSLAIAAEGEDDPPTLGEGRNIS